MVPKRPVRGFVVCSALCLISNAISASPLTWFPAPPLIEAASGAAAVVAPDKSNVLIGGDSYSPESLAVTNSYWTAMIGLYSPTPIAPGAVDTGDFIIVYGGTDGTISTKGVIGYSPSGDGQQILASMNAARAYLGYASDRSGNPYAIGGLDDSGNVLASAESYNSDANTWANITAMPVPRYDFPAVFDNTNRIYVFGGYTDAVSGVESASALYYSTSTSKWTAVAPMPVAVAGSTAAFGADGNIYVAGGLSGGVATNVVQVYNPVSNTWTVSTPLPEALSASAMGVDSLGRLIVMGGMDVNGSDVADVWRSQLLGSPDTVPVLTQYPTTNAFYLGLYSSSISAAGNPQPTYAMVDGPNGMSIDPFTGVVTWTPQADQIGTNNVTLRATNYAGYVDYKYQIIVPNPPPSPVSNLAVVGVTENTVTLSWDPEPAVAGSVVYSAWTRHVIHDPRGSGATVWYTQVGSSTTATTLTIGGLSPGLSQAYYLVANGPGGTSGTNVNVAATTLSLQPPANVRVTGITSKTISFAWDPPSGPIQAVSYEIWGWDDFGISSVSASYGSGISSTFFTVTGLTPGSSHNWAVRGYDAAGYASAFSFFGGGYLIGNPVPVSPVMNSGVAASDGTFQFTVSEGAYPLQTVMIQATTNPADPNSWVQIGSVFPTSNPFTFTDTNALLYPSRFYRIIAP